MSCSRSLARQAIRVVTAASVMILPLAAPSTAQVLSCGAILTQDTTLQNDLVNCAGPGLIVGAPNIKVNLNGHTVDGDSMGFFVGINNEGHAGVTIRNGTVRDFAVGIAVVADANHVWGVEVANASFGFVLAVSRNSVIEKSTVHGSGQGFTVQGGAHHSTISKNEIFGNAFGIAVFDSDAILIEKNDVRDNPNGGIFVVRSSATSVMSNDVLRNGGFGGIVLLDAPVDTRVSKNDANANASGIFVIDGSSGTILESNDTHQNTVDGIQVHSLSTTIMHNTANGNANWGINAVPGVIDGGGNKAKGNGIVAQCTGVVCS